MLTDIPEAIALSDVDGDDDLDLIVNTRQDNIFSIRLHRNLDGQGTYSDGEVIFSFNDPRNADETVVIGDMDGDGDNDIVASLGAELVSIENLGGTFAMGILAPDSPGVDVSSPTLVDWDSDGDLDVVFADARDSVAWFENEDGKGKLAVERVLISSSGANVAVGDMDSDGDLDFVYKTGAQIYLATNTDGQVSRSTAPLSDLTMGGFLTELETRDIDSDGDLDVMFAAGPHDRVAWIENVEDGENWITHIITPLAPFVLAAVTVDIDADDRVDVVIANRNSSELLWFNQRTIGDANGDGIFNSSDLVAIFAAAKYESGLTATWAEGDWNQDGLFNTSDLVFAFQANSYTTAGAQE